MRPNLPLTSCFPLLAVLISAPGCDSERPPAPTPTGRPDAPAQGTTGGKVEVYLEPESAKFVLTYAGPRGVFADTSKLDAVPEAARGLVRVTLLEGPKPPAGQVWVTNVRTPASEGRFRLETVARDQFEELAVGQGLSSKVEIPEGLEPPDKATVAGGVVVYKTAWCGVCKKLTAYLDRKGVTYEAKDIEADPAAAAELRARAQAKGIEASSVPVIAIGDELLVGFQRKRLEQLLGG